MKYKILAIEDDKETIALLKQIVPGKKYRLLVAERGEEGLEMVYSKNPDLILLDLMLPDLDGMDICRMLRRNEMTTNIPIIMLTARVRTHEKIDGLKSGADDYVSKPFSPKELIARIEAVLRRVLYRGESEEVIRKAGFEINNTRHTVKIKGKDIKLAKKEFDLLFLLISKSSRVLSESYLLDAVWEEKIDVTAKTVAVHIYRLRKKLGEKHGNMIETIRGVGYKFKD
ncbi:response regulator [Elusimicrobiota bacterium]